MSLYEYMKNLSLEQRAAYAQKVGVCPGHLNLVRLGHRVPSFSTLKRIVLASDGAVTVMSFFPDLPSGDCTLSSSVMPTPGFVRQDAF